MAGTPKRRQEIDSYLKEIAKQKKEVNRLRRLLMTVAPELIEAEAPPPVKKYSKALINRVLEMANRGEAESEWIAAFGISITLWNQWKVQHPALADGVSRAKAQHMAWWDREARQAATTGNHRFPIAIFKSVKEVAATEGQQDEDKDKDKGDASKLVLIDLKSSTPEAA